MMFISNFIIESEFGFKKLIFLSENNCFFTAKWDLLSDILRIESLFLPYRGIIQNSEIFRVL